MDSFFQHSQRGISRVGIMAVLVVVLGAAGIGWLIWRNDGENRNTDTTNQTQQDAVENARCDYDDQELCKFFAGWKATDSYIIESASESDGQTTTTHIQSEGDRTHVKFSGEVSYETITIGNTLYTKAGDTWYKQNLSTEEISNYQGGVDTDFTEPHPDDSSQVSYNRIGTEKCGDLTCFKYEVVEPSMPGTTQHIWFDDREFRLRRMQVTNADGTYDATFSYGDVNITEPSPVQNLGPNQQLTPGQSAPTTLPGTGDTPSPEELEIILERYQ